MIKFFRKIRYDLMEQNKTGKYLKYAIGEIVLVVIGILIALSINNWNEQRNIQNRLQVYAKSLTDDLNKDISQAELRKRQIDYRSEIMDSIFLFYRNRELDNITNVDVLFTIGFDIGYRPLTWYKASIDELKSTGSLRHFKSDSLKRMISKYYSFLDHLAEDYIADMNITNELNYNIKRAANFNYPSQLLDSLDTFRILTPYNEWFNSPIYEEAAQYNFELLTNDINDFKIIMNQVQELRENFGNRQSEYPRAINNAKNIIAMLEELYSLD